MWYRSGTISCTLNNSTVTGSGTFFTSQVSPSDLFFGPDGEAYEILSVVDDTHITIKSATSSATGYRGATVIGSSTYAIVHAFAGLSNADLANKVASLLNSWQQNEDQFATWIGGTALGGATDSLGTGAVFTDGLVSNTSGGLGFYPLSDSQGNTTWVKCPAAINNTTVPAINNSVVTTSPWNDRVIGVELGTSGNAFAASASGSYLYALTNAKYSSGWKRVSNGIPTKYEQNSDASFTWSAGTSGVPESAISWIPLMSLSSFGNLLINGATDDGVTKLNVNGNIKANTFTGSVSGNASTATKLQTARNINGVSFDGTTNITITDSTKEPTITAGASGQYWRGDKSWQTLNASAVGLGNVTNESKATMFTNPTFTTNATAPCFTSTVTATAPFVISSSVKVTNLNADMIEGFHASQTPGNNEVVVTTASGNVKLSGSSLGLSGLTPSPNWILNKISSSLMYGGLQINDDTTGYLAVQKLGSAATTGTFWGLGAGSSLIIGGNSDIGIGTNGAYTLVFGTNSLERGRVSSGGNFLLGSTTDNGVDKLQVTGTARASQGLFVGNTTNASNTALDWYEENPWTPVGNNITLTSSNPRVTRIGDVVIVTAQITWPTTSNTDGAQIGGLPYAARGSAGASLGYASTTTRFRMFVDSNTTIYAYDENGTFMTNAQLSGAVVRFTLVYHCN